MAKSDLDMLICAPDVLFNARSIEQKIAVDFNNAQDNFSKRAAISKILGYANSAARDAIKAAYLTDPFKTRETTRAYTYLTDQLVKTALTSVIELLHPNPNPTSS